MKRRKEERKNGEEKKRRGREEKEARKSEGMRGFLVTPLSSLTAWLNGAM